MIQRKQSVFLLLAVISTVVCLCLPIATFEPKQLGVWSEMFNLWLQNGNGSKSLSVCPLFCILLLNAVISLATIFLYRNRKLQIKLCSLCNLLVILWYAAFIFFVTSTKNQSTADFHISFAAVLPIVSMILVFMARKGVKADEALIRAAERIR